VGILPYLREVPFSGCLLIGKATIRWIEHVDRNGNPESYQSFSKYIICTYIISTKLIVWLLKNRKDDFTAQSKYLKVPQDGLISMLECIAMEIVNSKLVAGDSRFL